MIFSLGITPQSHARAHEIQLFVNAVVRKGLTDCLPHITVNCSPSSTSWLKVYHGCRKGFRSGGAIARSRGLEAVVHT